MKNNLLNFFSNIHAYPDYIPSKKLCEMLSLEDIKTLQKEGVLARSGDLAECLCNSCEIPHFVEVKPSEKGAYTYCAQSDHGRNYIDPHEVETWKLDIGKLINILALKLDLAIHMESMEVSGLWQIGIIHKDIRQIYYFYTGNNDEALFAFFRVQPMNHHRYIVLCANRPQITFASKQEVIFLELSDFVVIRASKLKIIKSRFDKYLQQELRNVFFDEDNGELKVNGQLVAEIQPSTPEFYFVEVLWINYNTPVSHEDIKGYIFKKTGKKADSTTAPNYTKAIRGKLKNCANEPVILDKLIISQKNSKNQNGYKMRNLAS